MKKFFLFLITPLLAWAQFQFVPISADYASFYATDSTAFVQVYLSIYQGNLSYQKNKDGRFVASFATKVDVSDKDKMVSQLSHRYQNTTSDTTNFNRFNQFVDVFNMELPYGKYKAAVQMLDNNSSLRGEYILDLETIKLQKNIFFSDIELCTEIKRDTTRNMFFKNGLRVVPNPRSTYDVLQPMLYYYVEINHLPFSAGQDHFYTFEYSITNSKGDTIKSKAPVRKKVIGSTLVEAGGLNVIALPKGNYFLNMKAIESESSFAVSGRKKLRVYKPSKEDSGRAISKLPDIDEVFVSFTKQQLLDEFKQAVYLSNTNEKKVFENLENVQAMKKFLTEFWRLRDKQGNVPLGSNRREYMKRMAYVNAKFSSMGRKGWQTDRGRVYLIYGEPDEYERHTSSMDTQPYVIWSYHNLEGGAIFVFADRSGFGDYELLHSTYRKELQNPNWEQLIRKSLDSNPFQNF